VKASTSSSTTTSTSTTTTTVAAAPPASQPPQATPSQGPGIGSTAGQGSPLMAGLNPFGAMGGMGDLEAQMTQMQQVSWE